MHIQYTKDRQRQTDRDRHKERASDRLALKKSQSLNHAHKKVKPHAYTLTHKHADRESTPPLVKNDRRNTNL